jgi:hypothetical protein
MSPEALADTRVVLSAWKWFSERTWSSIVVLGNHPCSVGRIGIAIRSNDESMLGFSQAHHLSEFPEHI